MSLYPSVKFATAVLLITIFVLGCIADCVRGSGGEEASEERNGKVRDYPEKRKSRKGFEYILDVPGLLLVLPFELVLKGIGNTVGYIDETKLLPKIKDYLTSDDGLRAVRPTYSSRNGGGLKLYQKNAFGKGSKIELIAAAGLRSRQKYGLSFKRVPFFGDLVFSDLDVGYTLQPDELFFGLGPDSRPEEESNFALEQVFMHLVAGARPGGGFEMELSADIEHASVLPGKDKRSASTGTLYTLDELPGLESGVRMGGAGLTLHYRPRDYVGQAASGPEVSIGGGYYSQIGDDDYGYRRLHAELALYLHLFHGRMLVMRAAGQMIDPLDDRSVPFYRLSEIGRRGTVRGFSRGRFRDLDMVVGSIEYHYPIWNSRSCRLNAFLFADGGQVARDFKSDLDRDDLRFGFGGGIVLRTVEEEWMRFVVGKSEERWRIYFIYN